MVAVTQLFPGSTALAGASYDASSETLTITFQGGRNYTHRNVPEAVWEDLRSAPSPGRFWRAHIKDQYG